jgi:hypothetical protein
MPPKPAADRTCQVADGQCSDDYMAKGLCKRHYFRQYFRGTTELTTSKTAPDDVRYRAAVDQLGAGECWPWTGTVISTTGYGSIYWDGVTTSAHIAGWELATGLIAAGFWIDHACHNRDASCPGREECPHRRCQNPLHLEAVTPGTNLRRSPLTTAHQGWVARGASEDELKALIIAHATTGVIGTWQLPDCPLGHKLRGRNRVEHPERNTIGCRECMMRTKRFRSHPLLLAEDET